MKVYLLAAMLLGSATAANAVSYTHSPGAPDPGYLSVGQTLIDGFSTGNVGPTGVTYSGSYSVDSLSVSGVRAPPAGDLTAYFATPGSLAPLPGVATIDFSGYIAANRALSSLSFYWGSVDSYNTLEVLDKLGNVIKTIVGNQINNPADGNQSTSASNQRLFLKFGSADNFSALRFTSSQRAFEIDDIAGTAVPEPATWAMLIAGLGMVGVTMRRRRSTQAFAS